MIVATPWAGPLVPRARRAPHRCRLLYTAGALLLGATGAPLAAQQPTGDTIVAPVSRGLETLLDAPVNRATYRLGPGDVLNISVVGTVNRVYTASVSPEGTLLLPSLGVVRVLGLSLDEAQRAVGALVLRYYRDVTTTLSLAQIRSFKVFVLGDVPAPGVRVANSATRVSEVIPPLPGPPRRNIELRRSNGDVLSVDLVRFLQTGDLASNPTLRDGDALVVPRADQIVQLFGRVAFPGRYEYRTGETLAQLLALANAGGPFPSNASDTVRVSRFVGREQRVFRTFTRDDALGAAGAAFVLEPFDAIFIPEVGNFKVQKTATIEGQVVRPGTYPIRPETTSVRDLVAMAGGFTADASLADATVRRPARSASARRAEGLEASPAELLSDDDRRILEARSLSDPNFLVIDFSELFGGGRSALDQPVEAGDVLNVPTRRTGVTVLGAVGTPGIVPYAPGRALEDYVALAGGYGRKADRGNQAVLRARLGNRVDPRDVRTIDAGDQIIVPYRAPRRYLETAQRFVTTVTGIVLTIYTLKSLFQPR